MWLEVTGVIHDSARDEYNESQKWLFPSSSSAEQTATYSKLDFLSNGFKIRKLRQIT
jgi:hypothetical protein